MKVCVIGGGIVGLSCAYHLVKKGVEVTVVDRETRQRDKCSWGNAGLVVPSHFVPLAAPGMIGLGLRMLGRRGSPFGFRMSAAPWMGQFAKHCTAENVHRHSPVMRDFGLLGLQAHKDLALETGSLVIPTGALMACESAQALHHEAELAKFASDLGLANEVLDQAGCARLNPGIDLRIVGGVHYLVDASLTPGDLLDALTQWLESNGCKFVSDEVNTVDHANGKVRSVRGETIHRADAFVLATGAWASGLARSMRLKVPVVPGRGQSFDVPFREAEIKVPLVLMEARVAVSQMSGGVRFAGTMELGNWSFQPNMTKVRGMVQAAERAMPQFGKAMRDVASDSRNVWVGHRPCTPDGLPIIGRPAAFDNLHIATGHAMVGLSLGPATGQLVAESVCGEKTTLPLSAFSPDRFN